MKARLIRALTALLLWYHRGRLKVLLYHNVEHAPLRFANGVPAEEFRAHLAWLKAHCNPVAMDQSGAITGMVTGRVNVLITFDDGFANNAEVAMPLLREAGLSAVFFIIANCLAEGAPPRFQLNRLAPQEDPAPWRTVTGEDLQTMAAAGMTIGSHSLDHTDYREAGDAAMIVEAREARAMLEGVLGAPVASFAFPWGFHNAGQPQKMLGVYDRVFLTRHGFCVASDRIMPRNEVADLAHLPLAVSGVVDLFRRQRVWLAARWADMR